MIQHIISSNLHKNTPTQSKNKICAFFSFFFKTHFPILSTNTKDANFAWNQSRINSAKGIKIIQSASKEEDEEICIVASIALDVFMDPQASLRWGRRERVRAAEADEGTRPRRGVAGEVISGELGEGIESEEGNEGGEAGEEGDEEAGGGGWDGGGGRGGGGCGGGGSAVVEDFEVAGVAEP